MREKTAENYVENGSLQPLAWGRLKKLQKILLGKDLDEQDVPDVAVVLYLMPIQEFLNLPTEEQKFLECCQKFAADYSVPEVVECAEALERDLSAIGSSTVAVVGKTRELEEGERNPSAQQSS